ncbi:AAA family ATPase [Streptomyces sp. NPDC052052]|uniref:ATP-binding protein n=1 Tax=Streptomyces sp. NPDC052052 TaxID=3154756 RepID=UPI00341C9C38
MITHQVPPLRIRLLGGFRAERDGAQVLERWRRPGAQNLVKLLAVTPGHRLHREQVREVYSPGASPQAAMSSLRVALHTARHALQPELRPREESAYLLTDGQLIALSSDLVTVDADEVEAQAHTALAEPVAEAGRAARLKAVLDALGAELLPEDRYAEWLEARRTELALLRRRVVHALAETHLAEGRPEDAATLLEWSLSRDPLDERAHEELLRAHLTLRRPQQALLHYQHAREVFRTELGVRPGAVLEELYRTAAAAAASARPVVPAPRPPLPAPIRNAPHTPLVGREQALRMLTAEKPGLPPLTLVAGEAGIGKTRLAAEAARAAHRGGVPVLWGAGHEAEGQTPYGLWAEALDSWFAGRPTTEQAAVAARYPALAALLPALGPVPAAHAGPEEERARLFHAVGGLLDELAGTTARGILVVLDDLHTADLGSLQLLYHLARRADGHPWRFIATFREEELGADPEGRYIVHAALRQGIARRLELMRLSEQECGRLVAQVCDGSGSTADRTAEVFRLSAGNPLFACELAGLIGSGLPSPSAEGLGAAAVPETILGAVETRLGRLDGPSRALVDVLAAAGGDVPLAEAADVARSGLHPPLDAPRFAAAADRILSAGLIEEREVVSGGRSVPGYAFRHPLVRLASYGKLTAAHRRALHSAYADAVLGHRPDAVDALAFHLVRADDPRATLWLRRAAERAAALYANDSADRYYTELVARLMAVGDEPGAADARHEHAVVLRRLARYQEAERELRSALDSRLRAGAHDAATRSLAALAEVLCQAGRAKEARALLDGAGAPADDVSSIALALRQLSGSVTDFHLGRYEDSLTAAAAVEAAIRIADLGIGTDSVPLVLGRATGNRALCLAMLGRHAEAEEVSRTSLRYAEEAGDMSLLTTVLSMLSEFALDGGRHDEARAFRTRSLALAERGGNLSLIAFERSSLAKLDLVTGDVAAARAGAAAAVELARPFGVSWCLAFGLAHLAEVLIRCGELDAADAALRECAGLAGDGGDAQVRDAVRRLSQELAQARASSAPS